MLFWLIHERRLQTETIESELLQGKAISSLAHLGQHMSLLWGKANKKLLTAKQNGC